MNLRSMLPLAGALAMLACAATARADGELLPAPQSKGIVTWLSGGVGTGERAEMQSRKDRYNVHLRFVAGARGAYVDDVHVQIWSNAGGIILDTDSNGPWFFVKLPKGRYKITATTAGVSHSRDIDLRKGRTDVVLRWNVPVGA